ncbi:hypothetical protein [uncultured Vibrio sp.]|uniref:hypothetical protein n=1 Tax=uncultured Vibrio sp. TaxID=114054 RepID=UPI00260DB46D|nr:hypothetical protein [uncultured Vibrio sp.]
MTLSDAGKTRSDTEAQTRYSEEDTAEVLLLTAVTPDSKNQQTCLTLLNGETLILPWHKHRLNRSQWRRLSAKLFRQVVPCRQSQLPLTLARQRCKQLGFGNVFYLGHPEFSDTVPFAIAIKDEGASLSGFEQQLSDRFSYQYRQDIGLQILKNKE